ncbi:hypothetical protein [Candidatus Methylomirabilis sp.]|uniref:hypothetical protein n=1 Tax=Candidatus Methylomirabilis sp. TaxID=2032687 RepID=UPI00307636F8
MRKSIASIVTGLAVVFVAGLSVGWAQQATVKLLSPKDGEATGPSISVKWEFKKAGDADHIHLYLDAANQGPQFGTSAELKGVSDGSHTVRVIAATKSHQEIGPEASVKVSVKGTAAPATSPPASKPSGGY